MSAVDIVGPGEGKQIVVDVSVGAFTDVGRVRACNEDCIYTGASIWAVADGMGGHSAGDVASHLVVSHLAEADRENLTQGDIQEALQRANQALLHYGRETPAAAGLGSTVTGVAHVRIGAASHWAVFNVGDSRVYRMADGNLARATVDHSEVEELILAGTLTEDEARSHSSRSVITRSIGSDPAPHVDLWVSPHVPGERFLLCSDGLTSEVPDAEIADILGRCPDADGAARELCSVAVARGGRDNVSVVVIEVDPREVADDDEVTTPRSLLAGGGDHASG